MHNAISHYPLTDARPLFLNPDWPLLGNSPQFMYWAWHSMVWNISLVTCPSYALSQFPLCTTSQAEHETRKKTP